MGLFGLFKKKSDETKVGNVEDFISLTRVYFQSVIATILGITNIRFLPDVANFKRLFKFPTQGGKLGLEMCIRDRFRQLHVYCVLECDACRIFRRSQLVLHCYSCNKLRTTGTDLTPVSYTHLSQRNIQESSAIWIPAEKGTLVPAYQMCIRDSHHSPAQYQNTE